VKSIWNEDEECIERVIDAELLSFISLTDRGWTLTHDMHVVLGSLLPMEPIAKGWPKKVLGTTIPDGTFLTLVKLRDRRLREISKKKERRPGKYIYLESRSQLGGWSEPVGED